MYFTEYKFNKTYIITSILIKQVPKSRSAKNWRANFMRKQVNASGYFGGIAEKQKAYKPRMQLSSLAPNCCGHLLNVFAQSLPSSGIISLSPSQVSQRGLLTLAALPETVGLKMYNNNQKKVTMKKQHGILY